MTIKEKILKVQNIVVVALFVAVAIFLKLIGDFEDVKFRDSYEIEQITDWNVTFADGSSMQISDTCYFNEVKGEPILIETVLPDNVEPGKAIMLLSGYSTLEIFADGQLISTFAKQPHVPFGRLVGNIRVIAPLSPEYSGKVLTIKMTPLYTAKLDFKGVDYGDLYALKFDILYNNEWRVIIACVLFAVALLCIILSLFHFIKKENVNNWTFYHLGLFILDVQIWMICSSDLPQIIADATDIASFVSFVVLIIMPIHYAAFCVELIPHSRNVFSIVQMAGWCIAFAEILCYVLDIADPVDAFGPFSILVCNHLLIAVVAVYAFYQAFKYRNESKYISMFSVANSLLIISAVISLLGFYLAPTSMIDAMILGIGMVAFTIILLSIILQIELDMVKDSRTKDVYKQLAYMDVQTGVKSRTSFDECCDNVKEMNISFVNMIILDINNLKWTNDNLGHIAGDELIAGAAKCIMEAFEGIGECYRIGGDEFAVIVFDNKDQIENALDMLDEKVKAFNETRNDITLSVSCGCAGDSYKASELFMEKLFTKADREMYVNKKEWHKEHGSVH